MRKRLLIIIGSILILFLLYSVFYYIPVFKAVRTQGVHKINFLDFNEKLGVSKASIMNGAKTLLHEDKIYYINDSDKHDIYSIDLNGENNRKISDDLASCMCIFNNRIYFINNFDGLFSMKLDGSDHRSLDSEAKDNLIISGDWIYYLASVTVDEKISEEKSMGKLSVFQADCITKIKWDGSSKETIDGVYSRNFSINEDWIFYVDDKPRDIFDINPITNKSSISEDDIYKNIYAIKMDGSNKRDLGVKTYSEISASKGWLYYFEKKNGLFKLRFDGDKTEVVKIAQQCGSKIRVYDDDIYFIQSESPSRGLWGWEFKGTIYRIRNDGQNLRKVCEDNGIEDFDVIEPGIFYNTYRIEPASVSSTNFISKEGKDKQLFVSDLSME